MPDLGIIDTFNSVTYRIADGITRHKLVTIRNVFPSERQADGILLAKLKYVQGVFLKNSPDRGIYLERPVFLNPVIPTLLFPNRSVRVPVWDTGRNINNIDISGEIHGTVKVEGVLQTNVLVSLHFMPSGILIDSCYTDDNGQYHFIGLRVGEPIYFVVAHNPDFGMASANFVRPVNMDGVIPPPYVPPAPYIPPYAPTTRAYPPAFTTTYIKGSSEYNSKCYLRVHAFNPGTDPIGVSEWNSWIGSPGLSLPLKINVDYGVPITPVGVFIHNYHHSGEYTWRGIKTVRVYGSNSITAFNNITPADETGLTLLAIIDPIIHSSSDVEEEVEYTFANSLSFQYIIFMVTAVHTVVDLVAVRRIVLKVLE